MSIVVHRANPETRAQRINRAALALGLLGLGIWTLQNFLSALAWAAIFAIVIWPSYRRVQLRAPRLLHGLLLPAIFTLGVGIVLVLPLALIAVQLGQEAHGALDWLRDIQHSGIPAPDWLGRLPVGAAQAKAWWAKNLANPQSTSQLLGRWMTGDLMRYGRNLGSLLLHRVMLFAFTLLGVFFLFRDGETVSRQCSHASHRLFGPRGERIGRQMIDSIHGTVTGLVLVGLGQGVLLGIAYAIAGVPNPTLFGALTAVAAMIPFGAPIAYGLASLLLLAQEHVGAAISVFAFGTVVLFIADHAVRPALIGGATRLPFLWVLLGILGGVEIWGLIGLFLGPAVMAALILLWRELADEAPPATGVAVRA